MDINTLWTQVLVHVYSARGLLEGISTMSPDRFCPRCQGNVYYTEKEVSGEEVINVARQCPECFQLTVMKDRAERWARELGRLVQ